MRTIRSKNNNLKKSLSISAMKPLTSTIAQFNKVSIKMRLINYDQQKPLRILLPQFFNIPAFKDINLELNPQQQKTSNILHNFVIDVSLKKRIKDLMVLAEGMKRAKNIKQQSRYYFIMGVMMHNEKHYLKAIDFFDKFLKIVIFIKDQKSIELALNTIGIQYMYLRQPKEALQYHLKQTTVSQRPQQFIGKVNQGICYQLMGQYQQAHRSYQQIRFQELKQPSPNKQKLDHIQHLIQRVQKYILSDDAFMTQNFKQNVSKQYQQNSKRQYKSIMEHSPSRKQYQNAKVNFAVCKAQQKIDKFLQKMKRSYDFSQRQSL